MNETIKSGSPETAMTPQTLAQLGAGHVAYVRTFQSEDVNRLFPGTPHIQPGHKLWALLAADGTPIVLADTPQAVLENAQEQNLVTVSVH